MSSTEVPPQGLGDKERSWAQHMKMMEEAGKAPPREQWPERVRDAVARFEAEQARAQESAVPPEMPDPGRELGRFLAQRPVSAVEASRMRGAERLPPRATPGTAYQALEPGLQRANRFITDAAASFANSAMLTVTRLGEALQGPGMEAFAEPRPGDQPAEPQPADLQGPDGEPWDVRALIPGLIAELRDENGLQAYAQAKKEIKEWDEAHPVEAIGAQVAGEIAEFFVGGLTAAGFKRISGTLEEGLELLQRRQAGTQLLQQTEKVAPTVSRKLAEKTANKLVETAPAMLGRGISYGLLQGLRSGEDEPVKFARGVLTNALIWYPFEAIMRAGKGIGHLVAGGSQNPVRQLVGLFSQKATEAAGFTGLGQMELALTHGLRHTILSGDRESMKQAFQEFLGTGLGLLALSAGGVRNILRFQREGAPGPALEAEPRREFVTPSEMKAEVEAAKPRYTPSELKRMRDAEEVAHEGWRLQGEKRAFEEAPDYSYREVPDGYEVSPKLAETLGLEPGFVDAKTFEHHRRWGVQTKHLMARLVVPGEQVSADGTYVVATSEGPRLLRFHWDGRVMERDATNEKDPWVKSERMTPEADRVSPEQAEVAQQLWAWSDTAGLSPEANSTMKRLSQLMVSRADAPDAAVQPLSEVTRLIQEGLAADRIDQAKTPEQREQFAYHLAEVATGKSAERALQDMDAALAQPKEVTRGLQEVEVEGEARDRGPEAVEGHERAALEVPEPQAAREVKGEEVVRRTSFQPEWQDIAAVAEGRAAGLTAKGLEQLGDALSGKGSRGPVALARAGEMGVASADALRDSMESLAKSGNAAVQARVVRALRMVYGKVEPKDSTLDKALASGKSVKRSLEELAEADWDVGFAETMALAEAVGRASRGKVDPLDVVKDDLADLLGLEWHGGAVFPREHVEMVRGEVVGVEREGLPHQIVRRWMEAQGKKIRWMTEEEFRAQEARAVRPEGEGERLGQEPVGRVREVDRPEAAPKEEVAPEKVEPQRPIDAPEESGYISFGKRDIKDAMVELVSTVKEQLTTGSIGANVRSVGGWIRKMGEPGETLYRSADKVEIEGWRETSSWQARTRDLMKPLSKQDQIGAAMVADSFKPKKHKITDAAREAGERLREILDEAPIEMGAAGVKREGKPLGLGKHAFPQRFNLEGQKLFYGNSKKSDSFRLRLAQDMVKSGKAKDVDEALEKLNAFRRDTTRGTYEYFERKREISIPEEYREWRWAEVLPSHFEQAGLLVAGVREWGADFRGLDVMIDKLGATTDPATVEQVRDYFKTQFRAGKKPPRVDNKWWGLINAYESVTKLGLNVLSVMRNLGQPWTTTAVSFPAADLLASYTKLPPVLLFFTKGYRRAMQELADRGLIRGRTAMSEVDVDLRRKAVEQALGPFIKGELDNQGRTALVARERLPKDMAALIKASGKDSRIAKILNTMFGPKIAETLDALVRGQYSKRAIEKRLKNLTSLTDAQLAEKVAKGERLTPREVEDAAYRAMRGDHYPQTLLMSFKWWPTHPFWRMVGKFKPFPARNAGRWHRWVASELVSGNVQPLMKWMFFSILMNELIYSARDLALGKERSVLVPWLVRGKEMGAGEVAERLTMDLIMGGGLLYFDLLSGMSDWIVGPARSTLGNIGDAAIETLLKPDLTGAKDAAKKFLREEIPIIKHGEGTVDLFQSAGGEDLWSEYSLTRMRAWDYRERGSDLHWIQRMAKKAVYGFEERQPGLHTLEYAEITSALLNNNLDVAAQYMAGVLKKDGDAKGLRQSKAMRSPLGPVAEKDRKEFLMTLPEKDRYAAQRLQQRYLRRWEQAFQKAQKLNR